MSEVTKTKIDALIANKQTQYEEADRVWLEGQEDADLDRMVPNEVPANKVVVEKEVPMVLSKEDQEALNHGKQVLANAKNEMIVSIQANTEEGTWTEDSLKELDQPMLERVFKSTPKKEAALRVHSAQPKSMADEDILYPTGVEIEVKKS